MVDNRGAERLREILSKLKELKIPLPQEVMAARVGATQGQISRWARAARKPEPEQRARIEHEYGIGWRLWDEPIESAEKGAA